MDANAVVALVCSVAAGIAGLVYYLINSIKSTVDAAIKDILESLEDLTKDINSLRVTMAERNTVIVYLEKRLENVERACRKCQTRDKES